MCSASAATGLRSNMPRASHGSWVTFSPKRSESYFQLHHTKLNRDIDGRGVTAADVLRATDFVLPCFEIVDSRIKDWKIKIQDTVADNASCGVFVLGGTARNLRGLDLSIAGMVVEKNGDIVSTSRSEEHTSELQSHSDLVCRLLLEKKK